MAEYDRSTPRTRVLNTSCWHWDVETSHHPRYMKLRNSPSAHGQHVEFTLQKQGPVLEKFLSCTLQVLRVCVYVCARARQWYCIELASNMAIRHFLINYQWDLNGKS